MSAQPDLFATVASDAVLSGCGTYRYQLHRRWADGGVVTWVMLNPSTADANADDPTIRRCIGFTRQWGFGALTVVDLYALRATDPRELRTHPDPVGPDNDDHLSRVAAGSDLVVCAWGANRSADARAAEVTTMLWESGWLVCLGTTRSGHPRHPLYVPARVTPEPFAAGS